MPRVLDVGNCPPDHAAIKRMLIQHFGAEVVQTHGAHDTLEYLHEERFDLVLINRKLDQDYSDGVEILKLIKSDPKVADIPVMLVTNYQEHQRSAVAAGALHGFGKLELQSTETHERLAAILG